MPTKGVMAGDLLSSSSAAVMKNCLEVKKIAISIFESSH